MNADGPVPPKFAEAARRYWSPNDWSLEEENRRVDRAWSSTAPDSLGEFWRKAQDELADRVRLTLRFG